MENKLCTTLYHSRSLPCWHGNLLIGSFYILSPERVMGGFGLKLPSADPDTRAWLRLKGIRDIGSGLVVLTLMLSRIPAQ